MSGTKYVVSSTLTEPLPWENSILLPGDPTISVAALKADSGPDLGVVGSGQLVRSLLAANMKVANCADLQQPT